MKPQEKIVKFGDFMDIAVVFYKSLGIDALASQGKRNILENIFQVSIFALGTGNLCLAVVLEVVYLIKSFGIFKNILEITALLPCTIISTASVIKIVTLWSKNAQLTAILQQLQDMFPQTFAEQEKFDIECYRKHIRRVILPCALLTMMTGVMFNCYEIFKSIINYIRTGNFEKTYPYFFWYPFDDQTNWVYPVIYLHQFYAGYVTVVANITADLLLCCIITQLQMHFDFILRQLLEMVPRGEPNDMRCLKQLIQHHIMILRLSDEVNDVFGIPNLYTFVFASPIICFTGFQVSIGAANNVFGKYILFLICQLLIVFAVCYHGNIVVDSSLNVADAAYGQEWFQASKEYKKILLVLITRANNPSTLTATSFVTASLKTFSSVISTSYQFFALVRTMYSDG
ncbi:unnamed protein product [Hermetia illucens]|uniref:Odorant receptor n=1 Tax=Hermetia illucens TaxID=343691 RepID=A0A7R8YPW6_HERIL|nr:putative odorant receptor 92a [Hermetia illucens]CAD7077819.1 unnamed protein product [Hermetia illucens]